MNLLKVMYPINDDDYIKSDLIEFLLFLRDITNIEHFFLKWARSEDEFSGTNITNLRKLPDHIIKISFPAFYDDHNEDKNCMFVTKENFIQFLTDWQAFGKSGKKYMMLREEDGWISLEDVKDEQDG